MDSRAVIRALLDAGWKLKGSRGSHHQFYHRERPGKVTLQHPRKDIPIGTLKSIELQSGLRLVGKK
ncbi:MAG TPA: type II toxin-antitoxin system HicA family toxin [Allosphingosinicella sp.]|nr:type II toxin-antitoxin system HicA family toxin [Allosphingosinicella sp.]